MKESSKMEFPLMKKTGELRVPYKVIAAILQKTAIVCVGLSLCKQFIYDDQTFYLLPGEYIVPVFYIMVIFQTKMKTQVGTERIWDRCMAFSVTIWFVAPLWLIYNTMVIGIVFQAITLGLEASSALRAQENLNSKKFDEDEPVLVLGPDDELPKDNYTLNKLRQREKYLRNERKSQREQTIQEAIFLSGVDPKEAMHMSVV